MDSIKEILKEKNELITSINEAVVKFERSVGKNIHTINVERRDHKGNFGNESRFTGVRIPFEIRL